MHKDHRSLSVSASYTRRRLRGFSLVGTGILRNRKLGDAKRIDANLDVAITWEHSIIESRESS